MTSKLLKKYRSFNNTYFTHVSSGETKGKYAFNRQGMEHLFDCLADQKGFDGISEMPPNYSMLRCDFDFESNGSSPIPLYDINMFLNEIIPNMVKYLSDNIIDYKPENGDCCILTKEPYIKNGEIVKHGIHFCFPNTFINKQHFKNFEDFFSKLDGFDSISSNPWLMYNQGKSKEKGMYIVDRVVLANGKCINPKEYFSKYTVFNDREHKIPFTKPIEYYYPRILSISPYGRTDKCVDMINYDLRCLMNNVKQDHSGELGDCDEYQSEIQDVAEQYIKDELDDCYSTRGNWSNEFLQLYRRKTHICPTTRGREHDNIGGYVFGNKKNGKVYLGCYCNEGKAVAIGTFKTVETPENTPETKSAKKEIMEKLIQTKINTLINTNSGIVKTDKWVTKDILDSRSKCVVVKAGLGKGKTTASVDHINESNYDSIIVLTPRRSFAKSICNRLTKETKHDFVIYSQLKGKYYIISNPFIVIQVESLNRLDIEKYQRRNTLLLCDEIESILFQMTVCKTHANKHVENLDMFETLFRTTSKSICLDAFLSNRTLNFLHKLKIPYKFYKYIRPLEKRICMKIDKKKNFLTRLLLDLGMNKKIFLFSSSNKALIADFLPEIKKRFPYKKVVEYHSKFTSIDLTTINDNWKNADIVACTSTITVGCNFDIPDVFDKIFVYANACSRNLVRDIFQSTYRIRHIRDKTLVYCVDPKHYGINLSTDKREIETDLKLKKTYIVDQYEKELQMEYPEKVTPEWIKNLVLTNIFEQNISIMNISEMFQRYLSECEYEQEDLDEEELEEEELFNEDIDVVDTNTKYEDIRDISRTEMFNLKKKKIETSLSEEEEAMLCKYNFQCTLIRDNIEDQKREPELWSIYLDFGKGKFANLRWEKGFHEGSVRVCDIVSGQYTEIAQKRSLRVEMIDEIRKQLCLHNTQDFRELSRDQIDSCIQWFKENSEKIHNVFDIRNNKKSKKFDQRFVTELVNKVFDKWGYSKLKKQKQKHKRVNGKRVDITPYYVTNVNVDEKTNSNIDVYRYVKPITVKQTDRKVKSVKGNSLPM